MSNISINGNADSIYASPSFFVPRPVISTLGPAIMTERSEQEIISAWITNHETYWAWEFVGNACRDDPERGWHFVLAILRATDSSFIIECLGAGPLEDLLVRHGSIIIDRCLNLAATDSKFRHCLASTWQNAMEHDVWLKVCGATGRNPDPSQCQSNAN